MKDSSSGGLLAFIVAAPVVLICCAGKAALIGTVLFGTAGFLTGANLLTICPGGHAWRHRVLGSAQFHADAQTQTRI